MRTRTQSVPTLRTRRVSGRYTVLVHLADSDAWRSVIPIHADHRFRFMPMITDSDMPITDSDSCRSLWSERAGALDNRL